VCKAEANEYYADVSLLLALDSKSVAETMQIIASEKERRVAILQECLAGLRNVFKMSHIIESSKTSKHPAKPLSYMARNQPDETLGFIGRKR